MLAGNTAIIIGGDVLVSMDGQSVTRERDIFRIKEGKRPGDKMEFIYYHGNEKMVRTIELVGEARSSESYRF